MKPQSKIYFSYAWDDENQVGEGREKIVNELHQALLAEGYKVIRDKSDLGYKGLISSLTQSIGRGDMIIIAISDKYLRSRHCMAELLEIYRRSNSDTDEMLRKTFPIVLTDAKIYQAEDRLEYLKYWESKRDELKSKLKGVELENAAPFIEELRLYDEITSVFPILSKFLNDVNTLNPQRLSGNNFEQIKDAIRLAIDNIHSAGVGAGTDRLTFQSAVVKRYGMIVLIGCAVLLLLGGGLYLKRLGSTEVTLELAVSGLSFSVDRPQAITNTLQFKRLGVSGLQGITLPFDTSFNEYKKAMNEEMSTSVLFSSDTSRSIGGRININDFAVAEGTRIEISKSNRFGKYRMTLTGKESTYPIHLQGPVHIVAPPHKAQSFDLVNPAVFQLQSSKDDIDFDFDLAERESLLIDAPLEVENLSFVRIDEHSDNERSVVQKVSTIQSGIIGFKSARKKDYLLQLNEALEFQGSTGRITGLKLNGDQILLTF
ncbi:MAG: toll/interleukin-1 receptor domain-containing protein, partial [Chitinophagaceae bacterium]